MGLLSKNIQNNIDVKKIIKYHFGVFKFLKSKNLIGLNLNFWISTWDRKKLKKNVIKIMKKLIAGKTLTIILTNSRISFSL